MKPPQQNRSGKRGPGGGGPRRPGGPGDGPGRHGGGPRGPGQGAPRHGQGQGHGPRPPRFEGPRFEGQRPRDDRPRDERPRQDRPHQDRPQGAGAPREQRRDHAPRHFEPRGEARGERRDSFRRDEAPRRAAEHHPEAPRGTVWLYGQHAVAAALANPARRLRRLLLTEEAEAALAARLPQPWPLGPERVERGRLDHLLGRDVVHQGLALLADPLSPLGLAQALERPGPVLVLDQVADPRNVGAILRSAQAFGAAAVIVQERNAPEETGALAKAASGALEKVPLLRAVNIARTLVALKAANCWVLGLDASGPPLAGPALAQRRVALVLGSEGEGLRRLTRETCDEVVGIAMPGSGGGLDSLNVAAAATVALYELGRRA